MSSGEIPLPRRTPAEQVQHLADRLREGMPPQEAIMLLTVLATQMREDEARTGDVPS